MFWRTSSVIPTRFFPRNGPFLRGSLRGFAGCLVVPILTSLPPMPMPSFLFTSIWFRTRWCESRTRSSTLGNICLHMPSQRLHCSDRSSRECFFRPGSHWFWCTVVATERVVCRSFVPRRTTLTSAGAELACPSPCVEVPSRSRLHERKLSSVLSERLAFLRRLCGSQLRTSDVSLLPFFLTSWLRP